MTPEVEEVVTSLRALASAPRFRLLSQLRSPRALEEITLLPGPGRTGDAPGRPITRQAVQRHLDVLIEVGLVKREQSGDRLVYVLDHSRLFALQEELRAATAYASVFDTSLESAEILETPAGLHLVGIGRNPVTLNWRNLEQGVPAKLAEGDVIGVGRTLLLYRRS